MLNKFTYVKWINVTNRQDNTVFVSVAKLCKKSGCFYPVEAYGTDPMEAIKSLDFLPDDRSSPVWVLINKKTYKQIAATCSRRWSTEAARSLPVLPKRLAWKRVPANAEWCPDTGCIRYRPPRSEMRYLTSKLYKSISA